MVKVIFFKADKAKKSRWFHKLIAWKTRGPYSHCEIYFSRSKQGFSAHVIGNKCSFKIFNLVPNEWDIVDIDVDDYTTYLECKKYEGKRYDHVGIIFNFLIPINIQRRSKYFCSEVVIKILQNLYYTKVMGLRAHKIDPNKLYRILTNGNNKI